MNLALKDLPHNLGRFALTTFGIGMLFLTAVGLINPPTSGRIFIGGRLVMDGPSARTNLRTFRRNHIGHVFQKSNLVPFLSACENVQVAMELNGFTPRQARTRAMTLLDEPGKPAVGKRSIISAHGPTKGGENACEAHQDSIDCCMPPPWR